MARRQKRMWRWAAYVLLSCIILFIAMRLLAAYDQRPLSFDSSAWKQSDMLTRGSMVRHPDFDDQLLGISAEELIELLGPPDYPVLPPPAERVCYNYKIRFRWDFETWILKIVLNNNVVTRVAIDDAGWACSVRSCHSTT